MKHFTVTVGGQTRTIPGPDDASQEDADARHGLRRPGGAGAGYWKGIDIATPRGISMTEPPVALPAASVRWPNQLPTA